jgi:predicted esterase
MRSAILFVIPLAIAGCAADGPGGISQDPLPAATVAESPQEAPPETPAVDPPKPADDPGPAPAGCGTITKDDDGFFVRKTAKSDYVAFVPKSYKGKPTTLVVGLHGCGDNAYNFATWGVNPYKTRTTQGHIGISIGGKDGQCWDASKDAEKAIAAIEDISTCFYVHQQRVVLAGYSSGGILAYKLGLTQSAKFAGIIIENSGLGAAPSAASWKINVAHIAHKDDTSFPIARVRADWAKLEAAGIPLQKSEIEGGHDGTSDDWSDFLLPKIASWKAP